MDDGRCTMWKIPRRWRKLAERERSGILGTMRVVGSKAVGVTRCHLVGFASIVHSKRIFNAFALSSEEFLDAVRNLDGILAGVES